MSGINVYLDLFVDDGTEKEFELSKISWANVKRDNPNIEDLTVSIEINEKDDYAPISIQFNGREKIEVLKHLCERALQSN